MAEAEIIRLGNKKTGKPAYPVTSIGAVVTGDGETLDEKIDDINDDLVYIIDEISNSGGGSPVSLFNVEATFNANIITETYDDGVALTTTFNEDGSITEEHSIDEVVITTIQTTFNEDGSR